MRRDEFETLAEQYDSMMSHVNYERWVAVCGMIAELCPRGDFEQRDVGCGRSALVKSLRNCGWRSYGVDLSYAMASASRKDEAKIPVVQGDMRRLPFEKSFHFLTCVFDSLNFLLELEDFESAFTSMRESMTDDGVLYFDVITERMVLEHYAGRDWVDRDGKSKMQWHGEYDVERRIVENTIRVDGGKPSVIRERVYDVEEIRAAAEKAGLRILGIVDTETWCAPTEETLRLDVVASVRNDAEIEGRFLGMREEVQVFLGEMV